MELTRRSRSAASPQAVNSSSNWSTTSSSAQPMAGEHCLPDRDAAAGRVGTQVVVQGGGRQPQAGTQPRRQLLHTELTAAEELRSSYRVIIWVILSPWHVALQVGHHPARPGGDHAVGRGAGPLTRWAG